MNGREPEQPPHDDDHRLWEAALEAERRTGEREPTAEATRAHLLVRLVRICGGMLILLAGIVLVVLPGPGLALIVAGLTVLAIDVPFARRLRDVAVERADRATSFLPKRLKIVLLVTGSVVAMGASVIVLLW